MTYRDHLAKRGHHKPIVIERTVKSAGDIVLTSSARPTYRYGDPVPDWNAAPAPRHEETHISATREAVAVLAGVVAMILLAVALMIAHGGMHVW